jgi:hypothetical protein
MIMKNTSTKNNHVIAKEIPESRNNGKLTWTSLGSTWKNALIIFFKPGSLILIASAIGLLAFSYFNFTNQFISAIFTIIISLLTGLLGAIYSQKWVELNDEKISVARGRAAIRSLKLIGSNIEALRDRAKTYLSRKEDGKKVSGSANLDCVQYEEILISCGVLLEEVVSSIENWKDILIEADVNFQRYQYSELLEKVENQEQERKVLVSKLDETTKGNDELKSKIESLLKQIAITKTQLQLKSLEIGPAILSSGSAGPSSDFVRNNPIFHNITNGIIHADSAFEKCPWCGMFNSTGAENCTNCGNKLKPEKDPKTNG